MKLKRVTETKLPMDDLGYELDAMTWRFLDLPMTLRYYARLLRYSPAIASIYWRRSAWSAVHFAICLLEWSYLDSIVSRHSQLNAIYCGYCTDRKSMLLSLVCEGRGKRCVGVQHGAFNMFPALYRAKVHEVVLMYPFSRSYAERFFKVDDEKNIRVAPEEFDLGWREYPHDRPFVVFGGSADSTALNRTIIATLDKRLPLEFDLFLKLHPRDSADDYQDLVTGRTFLIHRNAINASAYVGQLSSVLAEAWTFKIPIAVMQGQDQRGSDFQRMLDKAAHSGPDELALAVLRLITQSDDLKLAAS